MYKFNIGDRVIVTSNNEHIPQHTLGTVETVRHPCEYAHFIRFDNGVCLWVHADGTWLTVKVAPFAEEDAKPEPVEWWETPNGDAWLRANMKEAPDELQPRYSAGTLFRSARTGAVYVLTYTVNKDRYVYSLTSTIIWGSAVHHIDGTVHGVVITHTLLKDFEVVGHINDYTKE